MDTIIRKLFGWWIKKQTLFYIMTYNPQRWSAALQNPKYLEQYEHEQKGIIRFIEWLIRKEI